MTIASEEWRYLVAQAPLPNTVEDFWQMVWGQQVHLIAMLTAVNVSPLTLSGIILSRIHLGENRPAQ